MSSNLFDSTDEFAAKLYAIIDLPPFDNAQRLAVSDVACSMSMEHWEAARTLLRAGFLPSGVVIHRAQFEALLRSVWLLYAATDEQLAKLTADLSLESEQNAKNLPQVTEMMAAIAKKGPPQAFDAFNRFKEISWKALNSFAHAGLHPIKRHAEGYPLQLIESITKNSNGLAVMSAMQSVVLTGMQPLQKEILALAEQFPNCMPARL